MKYIARIYHTIDFDVLGDTSHVSISGGVATHSIDHVEDKTFSTITDIIHHLNKYYGKPYLFDDRLEIQVTESESYSIYIDVADERRIEGNEIKTLIPDIEEI